MKFRIRPGFNLYRNRDEAETHKALGARSGVTPRARAGDEIDLSAAEVADLDRAGALGRLDPLDSEAVARYGGTVPQVAQAVADPASTLPPPEPEKPPIILYQRCPHCGR